MEWTAGTVLAHRFEITGPPRDGAVPALDRALGTDVVVCRFEGSDADRAALERRVSALGRIDCASAGARLSLLPLGEGQWGLVGPGPIGPSIAEHVGPLGARATVELGLSIADALVAAHRVGVVHGDVAPETVQLGEAGAVLSGWEGAGDRVRGGVTAPEVAIGGPAGVPADLYGLGVVLHQALHGRLPFEGSRWEAMGHQQVRPDVSGPRGLASLIRALLDPDPASRPANASVVRSALARLARDPERWIVVGRFDTPRLQWNRAWLVHGVDPGTGAPAVVRADLSKRRAHELVEHLRSRGWSVQATQEALGGRDVLWIGLMGALGGLVVPMLGFVPAALMAGVWRSRRVDANVRNALPALSVPLPPASGSPGGSLVVAGLLLLATAVGLVAWPEVAAVPAGVLVVWALLALRKPAEPPAVAPTTRVERALYDTRGRLDQVPLALDTALGIAGAVDAMEAAWRVGDLSEVEILAELAEVGKQIHGSRPMRLGAHPAMTASPERDLPPRLETT